jgi:hypothetical protein
MSVRHRRIGDCTVGVVFSLPAVDVGGPSSLSSELLLRVSVWLGAALFARR